MNNVTIGNPGICPAFSANYLGLIIDCNENFVEHIGKVSNNLSSSILFLRCVLYFQSPDILLMAYYECFHPNISYAAPIWGNESTNTQYLLKLQKNNLPRVKTSLSNKFFVKRYSNILFYLNSSVYVFFIKSYNLFTSHLHIFDTYSLRTSSGIVLPPQIAVFMKITLFVYNSCKLICPLYLENFAY